MSGLINRDTEEKPGWCSDPHLPPCAAYALSLSLIALFVCACVCTLLLVYVALYVGRGFPA